MRKASVAGLIALAMSVTHAQDSPDPFDPAAAVSKAWALLTSPLESSAQSDQVAAILALAGTDTARARDVIERIARDKSHPLRSVAISSLPTKDATYLAVVADALQDPDLRTRRSAIGRLGWIRDPRALPLLQSVILSGDADSIEAAVSSARRLGPLAFGILLHSVESGAERSREPALRCIEWLLSGSKAVDNLDALRRLRPERILVRALDDSNSLVRTFAALILARLDDGAGADELIRVSESPKLGTIVSRHVAMAALHKLGKPGYLALLTAALQNADPRVRMDAAFAMQSFPHPSMRNAWNAAWRGTSDVRYDPDDVLVAIHTLELVKDREAVPALGALFGSDQTLNLCVARALVAIGEHDAAAGRVLVRAMDNPHNTARIHAAGGVISLYTR